MGFTENCDLYGAVGEAGVNRVISDIMLQRPSLFNYATEDIAHNPKLWCAPIPHTSDVTNFKNPLFTIVSRLPVLGADSPPVSLGFCAQLTRAEIDFFPENTIPLPPALDPPLPSQRFSLLLRLCGAIECPAQETLERVPAGGQFSGQPSSVYIPPKEIELQGRLNCFCLEVIAIGNVQHVSIAGKPSLLTQVESMDVTEVEPGGLEANMVCYLKTTVNVVLREKLTIAIETLMLSFSLFENSEVTLSPTPDPPVPNNPAIEEDQLKAFMTMTV